MADEIEVAAPVEAAAPAAPPVSSDPAPVADPSAPIVADPAATVDPNDPMAALEAAMREEMGPDDPAPADPAAQDAPQAAIPEAFQQALSISQFVTTPEGVQQAVRAADEVWKVAAGQIPASTLLESIRGGNPAGFQAIVENLTQYIEQATGKKFGEAPATPPDPNQARLTALEARIAQEDQARQTAAYQQQVTTARTKAMEFLTTTSKGSGLEGLESTILQMCAGRVGVPEQQMVDMLLKGNTAPLEKAYRETKKELLGMVFKINANFTKKVKTLAGAVPAQKGAPQGNRNATNQALAPLPGESAVAHAKRLWDQNLV